MTTGDVEVASEVRRKRNIKCFVYVVVGVVLQTIIITVFALTVMRIKSPKVRFGSVTVESLTVGTTPSPSFSMRLIAQVTVKNTNFGHFKFENSTATFSYGGATVGEALIAKARARARETKRMNIMVDVTSSDLSGASSLGSDINSGTLRLSSQAKLSGKVHLFKIIKKKKSAEMSCTMSVHIATKTIQDLNCK
ncbi:hypothetical protein HHK36_029055 [Tetracentron sinense]|uniref:Late embryogenesis abundant protein LEA-2 subgroup domain-containing protein n=1 Tax=Tetracentron sinense TaxID=13715 RepID=A0A834YHC2_TETSI|nr:hypothetical protein HHK36_029055 [Tetracentron sinense]